MTCSVEAAGESAGIVKIIDAMAEERKKFCF
jgi:hypothetical protein